mmetsp:Transcript_3236/g.9197  ORF Transcript_3236/g.9197 Transcript_3236/m.9197 type:complete len:156 (-) Transcript_3236:2057-2524(-)
MEAPFLRLALLLGVMLQAALPAAAELSCEEWMAHVDTPEKSAVWQAVSRGDSRYVLMVIKEQPCAAQMRAHDGRGPLFWAYEFGNLRLVAKLIARGADENAKDDEGNTPADLKGEVLVGEDDEYEDEDDEELDYDEDYEEDNEGGEDDGDKTELK